MSKKAKKHTLNQYRIDEKICLEKAYAKGKEKGLKDDEGNDGGAICTNSDSLPTIPVNRY